MNTTTAERIACWCHALSDQTRVRVVDLLAGGEQCVCDIQTALGAAQSRLSFHLRVLREAGIVNDRKDGRWVHYSLRPEALEELANYLQERKPDENAWSTCGCGAGASGGEQASGKCC